MHDALRGPRWRVQSDVEQLRRFPRSHGFIGIYGWSNDPLVEYYIVEDSFGNGPATSFATTQRGTFDVDGATHRIRRRRSCSCLGKMYEARVLVEAGGGTGSIDFTRASETAGDD